MKHKYYLCGISLVALFFFSHFVVAQLVVDFSQSIGGVFDEYGTALAWDKVRINHVMVLTEVKNPFNLDRSEFMMMPYDVIFKACLVEGKSALQAIKYRPFDLMEFYPLFDQDPPCQEIQQLDFSESCVMVINGDDVQINNILGGYFGPKDTIFKFDPFRVALVENEVTFVTSQLLLPNQIKISIDWSNEWLDLDAHLTGPAPGILADYNHEPNRFHVYFGTKNNEVSSLHTDEFGDTKPEEITIYPPPNVHRLRAGVYQFTVHHFKGRGNIAESGAEVRLWIYNNPAHDQPDYRFKPPIDSYGILVGEMDIWNVFDLHVAEDGRVTICPKQRYNSGINPSEVR